MTRQKRTFGEQLAKVLGEGPGPRAVKAQKERLVREADRQRQRQRHWLLVASALAVCSFALLYLLLR